MRPNRTKTQAKRSPKGARRTPHLTLVPLQVVPGGADAQDSPTRWGRIKNARARAAAGYYDRPEVREQVLEAVLRELSRR